MEELFEMFDNQNLGKHIRNRNNWSFLCNELIRYFHIQYKYFHTYTLFIIKNILRITLGVYSAVAFCQMHIR